MAKVKEEKADTEAAEAGHSVVILPTDPTERPWKKEDSNE
jgi:hypothetical protein